MKKPFQKRGFSLVEILIVIMISSIILPLMMMILGEMTQQTTDASQITIATNLAREMMEVVLARRYDERQPLQPGNPATDWTPTLCAGSDCFGPDTGETQTNRSTLDDVDDFNGYSDTPMPGYSRNVAVRYAIPPSYDGGPVPLFPTNYKVITVQVTRNSIGTIRLRTVVGGWGN